VQAPVKIETVIYSHDSLEYQSEETWRYDTKGRLLHHQRWQTPPKIIFLDDRIEYNDVTGEKIEYEDANPADGKADKIYHYNSRGQLTKYMIYTEGYT